MAKKPAFHEAAIDAVRTQIDELETALASLPKSGGRREKIVADIGNLAWTLIGLSVTLDRRPDKAITSFLSRTLDDVAKRSGEWGASAQRDARAALAEAMAKLILVAASLDPIREPVDLFDPTRPETAGRLVALALVEQPRLPLSKVGKMYGSGVYAIYYSGDHPAYSRIAGTETPIYVGKADPAEPEARDARAQGPRLTGRLEDHKRMIRTVANYAREHPSDDNPPLDLDHFAYRRLVVATNAQLVAENHLIGIFRPVWNSDMNVCWGISKHGDAAETRGNKRSPWDVLHPGRKWAASERLEDAKSRDTILKEIEAHFDAYPPFKDRSLIIDRFLAEFQQLPVELRSGDDGDEQEEGP